MSRLWESHRYRGLRPGPEQLLLRALLRGQGRPSVQPLQKGETHLHVSEATGPNGVLRPLPVLLSSSSTRHGMPQQATVGRATVRVLFCVPQALTKGGVTYKEEVWHKECFLCAGCSSPLAGQPFTSQGDGPYCIRCFSSLYAKKCAGCNTAITGQWRARTRQVSCTAGRGQRSEVNLTWRGYRV